MQEKGQGCGGGTMGSGVYQQVQEGKEREESTEPGDQDSTGSEATFCLYGLRASWKLVCP